MKNITVLFGKQIGYTSIIYYLLLIACVIAYYLIPRRHRWTVLLTTSAIFYSWLFQTSLQIIVFITSIILSWGCGLVISKHTKKTWLAISIIISALPLFISDGCKLINSAGIITGYEVNNLHKLIIPIGLSFYTLQIIAYLSDIYRGKIEPESNLLKYALFISFFPQLIQGPIPRYKDLQHQLTGGNNYDSKNIKRAFQLILWGFFLKFMIADKAAVVVNTVFNSWQNYSGGYYLVAGILYSIQLYTDFYACTSLSQGAAKLFGINLSQNFNHPYFSTSVKDFWRRWHISLSYWLRDYIYIPLGGNRKGKIRKYLNLLITFSISGLWHGGSVKFLFWGLLHAIYQVVGSLTVKNRDRIYLILGMNEHSRFKHFLRVLGTSFFIMLGWIVFRADRLQTGLSMIGSIFTDFNPWIFSGTYLFNLGLGQNEWIVLLLSILLLCFVSRKQERRVDVGREISSANIIARYTFYIATIVTILIFGTYGYGFDSQDFIYGGF